MNTALAEVTQQLRSVRKQLRRAERNSWARQQRVEQAGRSTVVWWTVLAAYFAANQLIELSAQCWCQQRQVHHCTAERISTKKGQLIVRKWVNAVTADDLDEISNTTTPKIERALAQGINFVKQAGMAIWVLDHNRRRGHAPTTAQLLQEWGTPAFERTVIAETEPDKRCTRARHSVAATRWRTKWFARFGRVRVRERLNVDNVRQKVGRPVKRKRRNTVLFLSPISGPRFLRNAARSSQKCQKQGPETSLVLCTTRMRF